MSLGIIDSYHDYDNVLAENTYRSFTLPVLNVNNFANQVRTIWGVW